MEEEEEEVCVQKLCWGRFLACMASRMGCLLAWYLWWISSISCSIWGSREASRARSSSTLHDRICPHGHRHTTGYS